jgi:hypothetical protein
MGGKIVRTIGIAMARFKIGMMNIGYNIRRLAQFKRVGPVVLCKLPARSPASVKTIADRGFTSHERCNRSLN